MARPTISALPTLAVLLVLSTALLGANCKSKDAPAPLGGGAAGPTRPAADATRPPDEGLTEEEVGKLLPGIESATLSPKQRADLNDLANDTFCPCASMTVAGCLRAKVPCKPAVRLVELSKKLLVAGQGEPMVLVRVESYYASFGRDRRKEVEPEGPTLGAPAAKVSLVEFSDFQCPACRAAHPALEELVKKYPNDVKWVFRLFPLPQHEHAAKAALCAAWAIDQGKFWPFAGELFSHQDNLDDDGIKKIAASVGLDAAAMFKAVEENPKFAARVEKDKQAGNDLNLSGTPSIFINGRQLVGLPPTLEMLSWTVEDELDWLANGGTWAAAK